MIFIWRGSGITVPIFLFISGWIMSFWFPDTRLGNYPFIGWSMLWAGILLTLQGAAVWGGGVPDPETGEIPLKRGHDFFWIPVLFWGIGLIGLSIWLINKEPKESFYSSNYEEVIQNIQDEDENEETTRLVNFYNPFKDSVFIELFDAKTKESIIDATIPPLNTRYKEFEFNRYDIVIDENKYRITIGKSKNPNSDDYDEVWYVLGGGVDILLVDVTEACDEEVTREDLRGIDWTERITKRYDGDNLIEPSLISTPKKKRIIFGIGDKLPLEHRKKEIIYALIPIEDGVNPTDEYLDEKIIRLCFKDEE